MKGLTKKVGPLPLWMWLAIVGAVGYLAWRRSQESEVGGVEEGYFPTQGIPIEEQEGSASSGLAGLGEFIDTITQAGYVPAGSEEARGEGAEPAGNPWREWWEEGGEPRAAPAAAAASVKKGAKKAGRAAKGAGNKAKGTQQGGANRGRKRNQHEKTHTAGTSHQPAAHPVQRIGAAVAVATRPQRAQVGKGHPATGGHNKGGGGKKGQRR